MTHAFNLSTQEAKEGTVTNLRLIQDEQLSFRPTCVQCETLSKNKTKQNQLGVLAQACNPHTQEVEAGGSCEFEASLDYIVIVRPYLRKTNKRQT